MTVTRCRTKGCPFTPDEHEDWMVLCSQVPEHGHRHDKPSHQHVPKKGMGGNNPKSKIRAILCWPLQDAVDNGTNYDNTVTPGVEGEEVYILWDTRVENGWEHPLIRRVIKEPKDGLLTGDVGSGPSDDWGGVEREGVERQPQPGGDAPSVQRGGGALPVEAGSDGASTAGVPADPLSGDGSSPSASAPSASAEQGVAVEANMDSLIKGAASDMTSTAAAPSPLTEDWSELSDDDLQAKYDAADKMQGIAFLVKCRVVWIYRDNHIQAWGETWTEQGIERFGVSRRTLEAYGNIWEICAIRCANLLEQVPPLTDSKSLMAFIGQKKPEDGAVAMEAAVAHLAEYAEPPTVKALAHRLGEEQEERERHDCPLCHANHQVKA